MVWWSPGLARPTPRDDVGGGGAGGLAIGCAVPGAGQPGAGRGPAWRTGATIRLPSEVSTATEAW
ncbi:hypothetical protein C1701_03910 [Actinoalloteichus sp. AHMU CJ021]|nr:hypothetical protein C1701_03910 [Actinoalloteichus sp. AHMU CJ021]